MIACPVCSAQNLPNTVFCEECGRNLLETQALRTISVEKPSLADAEPSLRISVQGDGRLFALPYGQDLLIGRRDSRGGILPAVDLTSVGGIEQGVSRRHAQITFEQGQPFISDLNSTNGTWLGSRLLAPYERTPLRDGDELTLGTLVLHVRFP